MCQDKVGVETRGDPAPHQTFGGDETPKMGASRQGAFWNIDYRAPPALFHGPVDNVGFLIYSSIYYKAVDSIYRLSIPSINLRVSGHQTQILAGAEVPVGDAVSH